MNKLEIIELEPYEAPALEELELSVLRGESGAVTTNPAGDEEIPGGDDPLPDF